MDKKSISYRMSGKKPAARKKSKPVRSSGTMVRGVMNILGGPMKAGLK